MEFGEGVKKIFLAGVGAAATTAETTKDIIDKLVEKGELTVEQGRGFNEELKRNAKDKIKEHVSVNVTKNFSDAFDSVENMSAEELQKLKERIAEVEAANKNKAEEKEEDGHSTEA
ncbi:MULTISPECIES: phasin family protein [Anaerostipes]|uniref:Poly(Hydroxyalcanoate) granule associated protein (Phasin) n=1 Tax=Anaerostipes butyraticus TaxID=645466 RepID=A0A916QB21_9FIRM|nr:MULTISPECIES: phasin family protein [Anaerostipes]GFO85184.1 hypothetical protein ANBU17_15310 [Anaerostipes butyraticus]HJC82329.1 phasin family protein [Candidatus Anaerostipes avicola]